MTIYIYKLPASSNDINFNRHERQCRPYFCYRPVRYQDVYSFPNCDLFCMVSKKVVPAVFKESYYGYVITFKNWLNKINRLITMIKKRNY